jgi:predicted anti-sigma-YlaC factor YlaD
MRYPMKCRNVQKKLSAYQDRELKLREREEVSSHLLSCRSCREQYEKLEGVWQTLGQLREIHPDPWFYPQLIEKIKKPREGRSIPRLRWAWRLLPAPVIASILLVIGLLAGTYLGKIIARCDFFPFRPDRTTYSQEALFDSLKVFDPAPPGTLAHGYLQMVSYKENESK